MNHNRQLLTLLAGVILFALVPAIYGQATQQQPATPEAQQSGPAADPIRQLNLTPEQREQVRSIREQNKVERATINERLRESNHALETELNSDNPDEAVVEQRLRDVAAAQAAAMRMRILTEIRIRRVLTPEQRNVLRALQLQAKEARRERLLNSPDEKQRQQGERSRGLQNQRNGLGPIPPRRENPRRPRL